MIEGVELGLNSLVPISLDLFAHELRGDAVVPNTVEEAVVADFLGIESFNIAEHRRGGLMGTGWSTVEALRTG